MHRLKTAATLTVVLATLSGQLSSAFADRTAKNAEKSYQDGLALMAEGRHHEARSEFARAIGQYERVGDPPAKYSIKTCEATLADIKNLRTEAAESFLTPCDEGVTRATGDEKKQAISIRKKTKVAFAARAVADGKAAQDKGNFDRADESYTLAVKLDPRASTYAALCELHAAVGSEKSAGYCELASKGLSGADKNKTTARASEAKDKPNGKQQAALDEVAEALSRVYDPDSADRCLAKVAAAEKLGAKGHHRLKVNHDFPGAVSVMEPMSQRFYYGRFDRVAGVCLAIKNDKLSQPLVFQFEMIDGASERADKAGEPLDLVTSSYSVKNCREAVKSALDAGLSVDFVVKYKKGAKSVKAGEADAVICTAFEQKAAGVVGDLKSKEKAIADARLAPYRKVLKDDKIATYERYETTIMSGRRGVNLDSPAKLKKATRWSFYTVDRRGARPSWRMTTFIFSGHKLKQTKITQGKGAEPPAKAFP